MFCSFYLAKNKTVSNNTATTETRKKPVQIQNPENLRNFWIYAQLNLKTIKFYLIKLEMYFLTTKQFTG